MSNLYGPILIVEDVPNVLELLEVTLRFKGYAVLTARNGEEALEVIAETGKLIGMDMVEVNPILDVQNQTALLAVEFIRSALGSRVWSE